MRNPVIFLFLLLSRPISAQLNCGGRYQSPIFNSASQQLASYDTAMAWDNSQADLQMLIFTPDGDTLTKRPAVMVMHGGSFTGGNIYSSDVINLCQHLALRGYVTASVGYRLGIAPWTNSIEYIINYYHTLYRAVQDAKSAVRFLKANTATYGIDTSLIFIGGYSAGAVNALNEAFWQQGEVIPIIDTSTWGTFGENNAYSNRVAGVFGIGGAMQDTVLIENDILPTVFVHGVTDQTVPFTSGADNTGVTIYGSNAIHTYLQNHGGISFLKPMYQPGFHTPVAGSALEDTVNDFLTGSLFAILDHLSQPSMNFRRDTITASQGNEYSWFLNGNIINNQTSQQLIIQQSGYYQVAVDYNIGCSYLSDSMFFNKLVEVRDTNTEINTLVVADTTFIRDTIEVISPNITDTLIITSYIVDCDSTLSQGPITSGTDSIFLSDTLVITENFIRHDTLNIGCMEITTDSFFIPDVSNALNEPFATSVTIYPNPNNGSFTISLSGNWELKTAVIRLLDLSGKEIFQSHVNEHEFLIILPNSIQSGIYMLQLKAETTLVRKKLMIYNK